MSATKSSIFGGSKLTVAVVPLLIGNSAFAQLTTWEEDISRGKEAESQSDFFRAEGLYWQALKNFHEAKSSRRSAVFSCNCPDSEKCAETLEALLRVMYAEGRLCAAVSVCKGLLYYIEGHNTGPHDPALIAARANYKKLIDRLETASRWTSLAPLFKQYKFIGMPRTRVHELLGTPDAATNISSGMVHTEYRPVTVSGGGFISVSSYAIAKDDLPDPGIRDFYVLSSLKPDAPRVSIVGQGNENQGPFSWLDIDYIDDRAVKYRLRSRDETGAWVCDNSQPHLSD